MIRLSLFSQVKKNHFFKMKGDIGMARYTANTQSYLTPFLYLCLMVFAF